MLDRDDVDQLERLITKLPELLPEQAPSLIHGDLWQGNVHCNASGKPVLIDPACYWGWREADIAMTRLFSPLPDAFYQHYNQLMPMENGWKQRMPIYNVYHLLNHLNLFGKSYLSEIRQIVRRFT